MYGLILFFRIFFWQNWKFSPSGMSKIGTLVQNILELHHWSKRFLLLCLWSNEFWTFLKWQLYPYLFLFQFYIYKKVKNEKPTHPYYAITPTVSLTHFVSLSPLNTTITIDRKNPESNRHHHMSENYNATPKTCQKIKTRPWTPS